MYRLQWISDAFTFDAGEKNVLHDGPPMNITRVQAPELVVVCTGLHHKSGQKRSHPCMVHQHLSPQQLSEAVRVDYITDPSEVWFCLDLQKAFVHRAGLCQYQSDTFVDRIDSAAESWLYG